MLLLPRLRAPLALGVASLHIHSSLAQARNCFSPHYAYTDVVLDKPATSEPSEHTRICLHWPKLDA